MSQIIDMTGQKIGKLTVIEKAPKDSSLKSRTIRWICKCDCGNETIVNGSNLRRGNTKSCGCLQKEIASKLKTKDLTNKKFGKLLALEIYGKASNGHLIWKCKCDCGNYINVITDNLTRGLTQSCGCLKSKGEEKIATILRENNILFNRQKVFIDCVFPDTNKCAYFDFYLETPDGSYIIEYDGEQHFLEKEKGYYTTEKIKKIKERDIIKNKYCKEHNLILIRIPYTHYDKLCLKDLIPKTSKYVVK